MVFADEDDFEAFFIRNFPCYFGDWLYAKITKIAGNFIQPEIDLLDIDPLVHPGQTIKAFEFKVLKSRFLGNNYSSIYSGIGQAISYFKYGVDQSYTVIGISNNIPPSDSTDMRGNIRLIGRFVEQLNVDRFQILLYDERQNAVWTIPDVPPAGRFARGAAIAPQMDHVGLTRTNIFALNFTRQKGNNFFRRYNLNQYIH